MYAGKWFFTHTHTTAHYRSYIESKRLQFGKLFTDKPCPNRLENYTFFISFIKRTKTANRTDIFFFFLYSSRSTDRIYIGVFKGFLYTINKHTQILYEEKMKIDWRRNGQREQRFNRSRILTIFRIVKRDLETKMCLISAIKCLAEWRTRLSCHIEISIFRKYCLYVYVCRWKIATLLLNLFNFSWTLCVCTYVRENV